MRRRRQLRQAFMSDLCEQASDLLGPRLDVEATGGRSIMTTLDGGRGGTQFVFVSPLPRLTSSGDILATARNVAQAIHTGVTTAPFAKARVLGHIEPDVRRMGSSVEVTFYDMSGRPLPVLRAKLSP